MTLEEAEVLTTSTLSDSTPMSVSNVSSQPMSLSVHSEISAISQLSEAEKHELEDTIESGTEEYIQGFEEIQDCETALEEDALSMSFDEKCVAEMKSSEKHVRFPKDEATTDVLYTNERLSQSCEGFLEPDNFAAALPDEADSSKFVHCAVDELSKGRPKENFNEEEKESSSIVSSVLTDASLDVRSPTELPTSEPETMTSEAELEPAAIAEAGKGVVECPSTMRTIAGKALSCASSLDVHVSSEAQSLHSDEPEGSSSDDSVTSLIDNAFESETIADVTKVVDADISAAVVAHDFVTEVSDFQMSENKSALFVEGLDVEQSLILADVSVVSKGTSFN